ncbi:MAG TPA: hypothetical protein VNZ01_14790 [Solirubrobacteraceae bacterium]|nr:hypothetical protein [Solirubrobacteraceae bacterium]
MNLHARPRTLAPPLALTLLSAVLCTRALALPPPAGTQAGRPLHVAASAHHDGACTVEVPVIGGLVGGACEAAGEAAGALGGLVGEAAGAVGNGILDLVAKWMIGAATQITTFVAREMQHTTTPQLQSAWFQAQFAPMADLGAALGLLVTLIALASAAIRRNPQALAATLAGIARAGIGTGLLVALTVIALGVADQISSAVLTSSPHAFYATVAHAWGTSGFGGFGSSALAMLIALVEVFAAIFVWLELIVRDAAIYLAVLFFPVALAAAVWPALASWPARLGRLLLLLVILKPVALIVLSFAGNAAAAGLSFGGGASGSVGTILAATVIFALAAFAPWALMYLLAADAESAHLTASVRSSAVGAVHGQERSLRTAGGLRNTGGQPGGGPSSRGPSASGGAGPGGGTTPGSGPIGRPPGGGPSHGGGGGAPPAGPGDGALPLGGESIGAGSVGAAAGIGAASATTARSEQPQTASPSTAGGASTNGPSPHPSGGSAGASRPSEAPPQQHEHSPAPGASRSHRDAAGAPAPVLPARERPGQPAVLAGAAGPAREKRQSEEAEG